MQASAYMSASRTKYTSPLILTFSVTLSHHGVRSAVVGVDGVKMTSAKHRESLPRGRRRLEFGGGWAVVTEVYSLTPTKAGQNCHGRRKRTVETHFSPRFLTSSARTVKDCRKKLGLNRRASIKKDPF